MITIKIAKSAKDIEECLHLREAVFIVEQNVPADLDRDEYDDSALHFLALYYNRPVGTARVVLKENGAVAKIGRRCRESVR
jgi:predicted GNAT family N-acyltransferase